MLRPSRLPWFAATALGLCLPLLATRGGLAGPPAKIRVVARLGEKVGNLEIDDHFDIGSLNDQGQLLFVTGNADGDERLLQYAGGVLTPIAVAGETAPDGTWGASNGIEAPVSMNQLGNAVFATDVVTRSDTEVRTFLWEFQSRHLTLLTRPGMMVPGNRVLITGGSATPAINIRNEVALVAAVKNAAGDTEDGIFFRGSDGTLRTVALPDQPFPDGRPIGSASEPTINDAGRVGFLARRQGDGASQESAYIWENDNLTAVAVVGQTTPDGARIANVWGCLVNNANRNAVVAVRQGDNKGPDCLYLWSNGRLLPVAVPGKPLPGGGEFKTLQSDRDGIGFANQAGQHPLLATLADNSTAAYRMETDGSLTLLLKSGTPTTLGTITHVGVPIPTKEPQGVGVALNTDGQLAVTARFNNGPTSLVLMTPGAP